MDNNHNFLYVIWKDPRSRRNYIIGKLSRAKTYTFEYCKEYKEAQEVGWKLIDAFPEEKVYESKELFAAFAGRLPDPKRRGIETILRKYGLDKYDGYELLRKSTGRQPMDTYEFIDPIFHEEEIVQRDSYLMGIRHHAGCHGVDCTMKPLFGEGDELFLTAEPDNESDPFAVRVETQNRQMLGYIPRYYSEGVSYRLAKGMTYSCVCLEIGMEKKCEACIKVRLKIPREQTPRQDS